MQTFTYPLFFKILYRYGNIPITILLLLYLLPLVLYVDKKLIYFIPIVIILFLIYYINKKYLSLYKIIPYKIIADDEKLYCTDFIFSDREASIYYRDIERLKGGVFDGKIRGLMLIYDGLNKIQIGFYQKIKGAKELQTIILQRVNQGVYDQVVQKVDSRNKK